MLDFVNREMMMMVALIVSLAATYYLYNEMQKQKNDITAVRTFLSKKISHTRANDTKPVKEAEIEEDAEVESDIEE